MRFAFGSSRPLLRRPRSQRRRSRQPQAGQRRLLGEFLEPRCLLDAASVQIVDDTAAAPAFIKTGAWTLMASGYKNTSYWCPKMEAGDSADKEATWTFSISTPGLYQVSATWPQNPDANPQHSYWSDHAPFAVYDLTTSNGSTVTKALRGAVPADETQTPADISETVQSTPVSWKNLGNFNISGDTLVVTLSNVATKFVVADAVRIERVGALTTPTVQVIDDGDPGWTSSGSWQVALGGGCLGDVHYARRAAPGAGNEVASWNFAVTPGQYKVAATWLGYQNSELVTNRATDAPYTIVDGTTMAGFATINQTNSPTEFTENGVAWQTLGTFNVTGTSLVVKLSDSANKYVVADAVRIERVGNTAAPTVQILDDGDPGCVLSGPWATAGGQGCMGDVHYLRGDASRTTANTAAWTFTVTPGQYQVSTSWTTFTKDGKTNRSSNATYTIYDGQNRVAAVGANQTNAPNGTTDKGVAWEDLGTFNISGTSLVVKLSDLTVGNVIADAVRIERLGATGTLASQTVAAGDPNFTTQGTWYAAQGQGAANEVRRATTPLGSKAATWSFSVTPGSQYDLSATWPADSKFAAHAKYTAYDGATVLATYTVNQQSAPNGTTLHAVGWQHLGAVTVTGSSLLVKLTDDSTTADGFVVADAVRIAKVQLLTVDAIAAPLDAAVGLTPQQLAPITDEAIRRLTAGDSQAAAKLAGVKFQIADLPPGLLGEETDGTVLISRDAAGYGWFIDPTPQKDEEFTLRPSAGQEKAAPGTPAAARADLLTTVMHELGHVLGYADTAADTLMHESLALGVRRL